MTGQPVNNVIKRTERKHVMSSDKRQYGEMTLLL
jgi:hypothetical protein